MAPTAIVIACTIGALSLFTVMGIRTPGMGWFLYLFLTSAELGLTSDLAYYVVAGILLFSLGWYLVTKYARRSRGINVDYAFKEIPPE